MEDKNRETIYLPPDKIHNHNMSCCWTWITTYYSSSSSDLNEDLLNGDEKIDITIGHCDNVEPITSPTTQRMEEHEEEQQVEEHLAEPTEEHLAEPAEEQPAEEQPAEEQPAEEQPAEEQPAEEQPAEDDVLLGDDGTGSDSDTCTEMDYEYDMFEEADSDSEQLPEQQELAQQELAQQELAQQELAQQDLAQL
jgi:hypothetical protein